MHKGILLVLLPLRQNESLNFGNCHVDILSCKFIVFHQGGLVENAGALKMLLVRVCLSIYAFKQDYDE